MYWVVLNAHSLLIYKTKGSHLFDEQPTQAIVSQQQQTHYKQSDLQGLLFEEQFFEWR